MHMHAYIRSIECTQARIGFHKSGRVLYIPECATSRYSRPEPMASFVPSAILAERNEVMVHGHRLCDAINHQHQCRVTSLGIH